MVQVKVSDGILEGELVDNEYGSPYYSFKGIPYAEPPVGDLRFKAPQPKQPWDGVRSAKQHGPVCFQFDYLQTKNTIGDEDCLYLNVYTPNIQPIKPLPVMFYIHGGAFLFGSGNDDEYGPQFLIRKDVVVVTINYRLEVLGFLSLQSEDIPGNAGMKDQVAALRWVKKNIRRFGGDPGNITIFGESAGAASVHYHLISPMSKGLFKRAILQSGAATNPWAISVEPRERAKAIAKKLGFESDDDKELYQFFKSQPVEKLINTQIPILHSENFNNKMGAQVTIVDEKKFGHKERFFHGDLIDAMRNDIHPDVEIINGYCEHEGALFFGGDTDIDKVYNTSNSFLESFVPKAITLNCSIEEQLEAGRRIKKFYLGSKKASQDTLNNLVDFCSANAFKFGIMHWPRLNIANKIYIYKFTCKSDRNVFTDIIGATQFLGKKTLTNHTDDLAYIFNSKLIPTKLEKSSETFKYIDQVTTMWTNFAKYGNPTPDDSLGAKWLPYTLKEQNYLDIGQELTAGTSPDKEEIELWESVFKQCLPQYVRRNPGTAVATMVQVEVADGILEGLKLDNELGGHYYSFKGIPFAEPPIGDLRFKAPQPVKPWNGVRSAKEHGSECFQFDIILRSPPTGSEDCLYLNVYTPEIKPPKPIPVMVFIHGGAFVSGSGNDDKYGPEILVSKGVILVTINYRLEALGFLCLDTEEIPGNAGMKDQVAALRWVQKNIGRFGGDADNVTIFGESAGGASVSFHLISPMSKGLFRRAITQSGTAACWWASAFEPRERGLALARKLGLDSDDDKELYQFFKTQPLESLAKVFAPITFDETLKQNKDLQFGVVNEKQFGDNERFFHGDVIEAIHNGIHEGVEVVSGYCEHEGLLSLIGINLQKLIEETNTGLDFFVPKPLARKCTVAERVAIGKEMKNYYYKKNKVTEASLEPLVHFFSMNMFTYDAFLWQNLTAEKNKTYFYKFTCKSERNFLTNLLGLDKLLGKGVVCHADDLGYLFNSALQQNLEPGSKGAKMVDNVANLWTNFAKYGNPTPDNSLGVVWSPYTLKSQNYLDIGEELVSGSQPEKENVQFWSNIYKKYYPKRDLNSKL